MSWERLRAEDRARRVAYAHARQLIAVQSKRTTLIRKALKRQFARP